MNHQHHHASRPPRFFAGMLLGAMIMATNDAMLGTHAFVTPITTTTSPHPPTRIQPLTRSFPFGSITKSSSSSSSSTSTGLFTATPQAVSTITSTVAKLSSAIVVKTFHLVSQTLLKLLQELQQLSSIQKALFVSMFVGGFRIGNQGPFWKRYCSAMDIPNRYFGDKASCLRGRVVKVTDGDTIRFLHTPMPWSPQVVHNKKKKGSTQKKEKMSEVALPIRICTMDTPETPKFGKPGQPFGKEAKERLKELVQDQSIRIRLLQKDQYGRGVAQVYVPKQTPFSLLSSWLFRRHRRHAQCVDEIMLQEGLAEVYQGGGAVYGPLGKDKYLELEETARKAKLGMWSQTNRESAAEYKKRTK